MNGRGRTAVSEETKTMSPRRRSCIAGTNARTSRCAPTTVRSSSRVNRSESTSVIVPGATAPAFETTTSMSPRYCWTALANAATESSSVRSSGCTTASPPSARIWAATSSSLSVRRAPSATGKPARPSLSAVAAPMPELAPVTTAGRRSGWAYFVAGHQRTSPGSASRRTRAR